MMPSLISKRIVVDRLALSDEMLMEIRALPLADQAAFFADRRNIWTADSCLRRSLEALLDIGRHILAKGLASALASIKRSRRGLKTAMFFLHRMQVCCV